MTTLSLTDLLDRITEAVGLRSDDAGLRSLATFEPSGGPGTKIFPPTYPFGDARYAEEQRYDDAGVLRDSVLVDSFQSQANRCEHALLDAYDDGLLRFPFLDLSGEIPGPDGTSIPIRVTSLDAPHRGPDAYFRDSEDGDGETFDKTELGLALRSADARHARAYFCLVPTDLIYGFWDSQRGGRGVKLARSYTSEMYALDPKEGKRGAGRLDPMNIEKARIAFPAKKPAEFVVLGDEAVPKGLKEGKPSNVGHGNALATDANPGVSVTSIHRSGYISMTALANLRFPNGDGQRDLATDVAARAVLASLALVGDRLAFDRASVFLRSGCELLTLTSSLRWVGRAGAGDEVTLSARQSIELLQLAIGRSSELGLTWAEAPMPLRPKQNLVDLLAATFATPASED